jgi:2-polyprenyl-6-methoxyphenol hydroxylase-like FAD-dependent oxidoreductase
MSSITSDQSSGSRRPVTNNHFEIVIVGCRAAGAATAMLLARCGLQVLVLERGAPGTDALSTHALMRGGVMQLRRWGLLDVVVDAGTPPIRRTTFTYGDERVEINIKASHGVDALYAPRRTLLDPALARAATDAGAEIRYRTTVIDLLRRRDRVIGVRVRNADGGIEDITTDLVIGADGVSSVVADLVDAEVRHRGHHKTAITYGYWTGLQTSGYEWIYRADACTGVIPTNHNQACVFASARPEHIGRGGLDVITRFAAVSDPDLAARLAAASPPTGTRTWAGMVGHVRRAHGPGWALVGDAGYFKDPISAHGITDALRDAELLARAVASGFGNATSTAQALSNYEEVRDRLSLSLFHTVDRVASNEWDDNEIASLLRQLSSSMADEVDALAALGGPEHALSAVTP